MPFAYIWWPPEFTRVSQAGHAERLLSLSPFLSLLTIIIPIKLELVKPPSVDNRSSSHSREHMSTTRSQHCGPTLCHLKKDDCVLQKAPSQNKKNLMSLWEITSSPIFPYQVPIDSSPLTYGWCKHSYQDCFTLSSQQTLLLGPGVQDTPIRYPRFALASQSSYALCLGTG